MDRQAKREEGRDNGGLREGWRGKGRGKGGRMRGGKKGKKGEGGIKTNYADHVNRSGVFNDMTQQPSRYKTTEPCQKTAV